MHLFCDIDGLLIPFPAPDGAIPATHHPDRVVPPGQDQPVRIWLNPAHGPLLADLVAATGLEPVWCTSWRGDASRLIGHRLGQPPWPHVDLPRRPLATSHPDSYLWKRDHLAIHAFHAGLPMSRRASRSQRVSRCWRVSGGRVDQPGDGGIGDCIVRARRMLVLACPVTV